jgi:hypothetical protein
VPVKQSKPKTVPEAKVKAVQESRVKSSIPKVVTEAKKAGDRRGPAKSVKVEKKDQDFMDNLKRQEAERAVRMENQEIATLEILEKMRDNPNAHLHHMQQEVDLLSKKIDPILQRVERAQATIKGVGSSLSG